MAMTKMGMRRRSYVYSGMNCDQDSGWWRFSCLHMLANGQQPYCM